MRFTRNKIEKASKYLKKDIFDDFWPDILGYKDLLSVNSVNNINFNDYISGSPIIINIPKPTLILRPGHYLDFKDRIYYQILTNEFAKKIDRKLLGEDIIFSHRVKDLNGYFFKDGISSWKKFQSRTETEFNEHPDGFLLKTDITAYFEHINIKKLISTIESLEARNDVVGLLNNLLRSWSNDGIGIPQGHDPSSFLGNIYLNEVDQAMIADGFNYYRFADDIRVFELEEKKIRQAISKLTELLRPLNLHLSGGKTKIIQKEEYYTDRMQFAEEMEAIGYGLSVGENIENFETNLKEIWDSVIKSKKPDKTVINFCLNRFRKIKSKHALKVVLQRSLFDPSFTHTVLPYLELFVDSKSVQDALVSAFRNTSYDYQKIFILKHLISAKKIKFDLNQIKREEMYQSGNFMLIGYYLIFAYKFGNDGIRSIMKTKFNNTYKIDSKISRFFLIALNSNSKSKSEMRAFVKEQPILKHTLHYLNNL